MIASIVACICIWNFIMPNEPHVRLSGRVFTVLLSMMSFSFISQNSSKYTIG